MTSEPPAPTASAASAPTPDASDGAGGDASGPASASVLWSRWLALGWLVLFVLGCAAVALPATGLLQRLDLRAAFRGEAPASTADAPGDE